MTPLRRLRVRGEVDQVVGRSYDAGGGGAPTYKL